MNFDRNIFFEEYRSKFGGLNNYQVQGLSRLLRLYEKYYGWWDNLPQIANSLSQIKHETNRTFNPVVEAYYLGNPNAENLQDFYQGNNDRVRRTQKTFRYYPYFGMGDIQLTWLDNFAKHDKLLRTYFPEIVAEFETRSKEILDLVKHPRQVLDGDISFAVMTIGMHRGTFRGGRKLDDYKITKGFDHFNARGIVNGDKNYDVKDSPLSVGKHIEKDAVAFEQILKKSLVVNAGNISDVVDQLQELNFSAQSNNSQIEPVEDKPKTEITNTANRLEGTKPSNFLTKLWTGIIAVITGTIAIPNFLTAWLSDGTAKEIFLSVFQSVTGILREHFQTILVVTITSYVIYHIVKKINAYFISKLKVENNVKIVPAQEQPKTLKSILSIFL
jgi:hypothetical protein